MQKNIKSYHWSASLYTNQLAHDRYRYDMSNVMTHKAFLKNKLLSPQDNVVRKSLEWWLNELRSAIRDGYLQGSKLNDAATVAEIFNHATLVFISLGNFKYAREICYSQIQRFIEWGNNSNNHQLLKYVFQPWINLVRIDRLEGSIYDAFDKLNILIPEKKKEVTLNDNTQLTKILYTAINQDVDMNQTIMAQSVLERINLYLYTKQYIELIQFVEKRQCNVINSSMLFCQEASAVAYANLGNIKKAVDLLTYKKLNPDPIVERILLLRFCELQIIMSDSNGNNFHDLDYLYQLSLNIINSQHVNSNDIIFLLHTAQIMLALNGKDKTITLVYYCLEASSKIGDEVLEAESLVLLYELVLDPVAKQRVEDLMITHYFNTQYVEARKIMLSGCPDLKYVEKKSDSNEIIALYNDLLAFSPDIS